MVPNIRNFETSKVRFFGVPIYSMQELSVCCAFSNPILEVRNSETSIFWGPNIQALSPRDSARERSIASIREHKTEMAVFSSTKGGGDRGSICLDFVGKEPQSIIHGLTVDLGEHKVLEVSVFDTWEMARQHGWRGVEITKLCNYEEC
jgi:hypothetical protein